MENEMLKEIMEEFNVSEKMGKLLIKICKDNNVENIKKYLINFL